VARDSKPLADKEQRRFPRARVQSALAELISVLRAQITWPNQETSELMDLSYKGFAARRPGLFPLAVQERVTLKVELGASPAFRTEAKVAWCNLDWVGLEVSVLPPEGHAAMHTFLEAKLLGTLLRPIERALVGAGQSFQSWFQGPSDTHVFVWTDPQGRIERVQVTLSDQVCEFLREVRVSEPTPLQRQALLVLSQMDKDTLPMEEFVRTLA
jgi:hypothetical protein